MSVSDLECIRIGVSSIEKKKEGCIGHEGIDAQKVKMVSNWTN